MAERTLRGARLGGQSFEDERGIEFAYPTQTTFTAAPDGRMIMPYAEVQPVKRVDLEG